MNRSKKLLFAIPESGGVRMNHGRADGQGELGRTGDLFLPPCLFWAVSLLYINSSLSRPREVPVTN